MGLRRAGRLFLIGLLSLSALGSLVVLYLPEPPPPRHVPIASHHSNRLIPVPPAGVPPRPLPQSSMGPTDSFPRLPDSKSGHQTAVDYRTASPPNRKRGQPHSTHLSSHKRGRKPLHLLSLLSRPLPSTIPTPLPSTAFTPTQAPLVDATSGPVPRPKPLPSQSRPSGTDFTIVTGLFDIGRGDWWLYRRPYDAYLRYLSFVLQLEEPMVVFIEAKGESFVRDYRASRGLSSITHIITLQLDQLELFSRYWRNATEVIQREKAHWDRSWDVGVKPHPEAASAEYNLVVNSKPYLVSLAARLDPFQSRFFYWFDAGFGHGDQKLFPSSRHWRPTNLMTQRRQETLSSLYRQDKALVSGGFFGGPKDKIFELYHRYTSLFTKLLSQGYIDDDQTVLVLLINSEPELFNLIQGDWFDGLLKFASSE